MGLSNSAQNQLSQFSGWKGLARSSRRCRSFEARLASGRGRRAPRSLPAFFQVLSYVLVCVCLYICVFVCMFVCVFFHVLTISFRFSFQPSKSPSHFFVVVHARMPSSFLQTLSQLFKSFRFLNNIRQSVSQSGS